MEARMVQVMALVVASLDQLETENDVIFFLTPLKKWTSIITVKVKTTGLLSFYCYHSGWHLEWHLEQ